MVRLCTTVAVTVKTEVSSDVIVVEATVKVLYNSVPDLAVLVVVTVATTSGVVVTVTDSVVVICAEVITVVTVVVT